MAEETFVGMINKFTAVLGGDLVKYRGFSWRIVWRSNAGKLYRVRDDDNCNGTYLSVEPYKGAWKKRPNDDTKYKDGIWYKFKNTGYWVLEKIACFDEKSVEEDMPDYIKATQDILYKCKVLDG